MGDLDAAHVLEEAVEEGMLSHAQRVNAICCLTEMISPLEYTLVRTIGKGTFGMVYLVSSPIDLAGREAQGNRGGEARVHMYALKTVFQKKAYHNRELSILKRVSHRNIMRLYRYFYSGEEEQGTYLNIFCEYIPEDLSGVLQRKYSFSRGELFHYARQALEALSFMHSLSIAHRDLKPSNILIDLEKGVLKICDFGCAKELRRGEKNISYICSRNYRAPENLLSMEEYTTKIDVWSMGCVFAEMILHRVLFNGRNTEEQIEVVFSVVQAEEDFRRMHTIESRETVGIKEYLRKESRRLDASPFIELVSKMLVVSSNQRFAADELLLFLRNSYPGLWLGEEGTSIL